MVQNLGAQGVGLQQPTSARAEGAAKAPTAPTSRAIRVRCQTMPSPMLRFTPIRPATGTAREAGTPYDGIGLHPSMPNPGKMAKERLLANAENSLKRIRKYLMLRPRRPERVHRI